MSEIEQENGNQPVAEAPAEAATPAAEPTSEWVPRKDFEQVVGYLQDLHQWRQSLEQPQDTNLEGDDLEDADLGELVVRAMDSKFQQYAPVLEQFQVQQGQQEMEKIFSQLEADPEIGSFDHSLAEKFAFHLFVNEAGGDQRYSQWATHEGAKAAAQLQRDIGTKAVEEYKAQLKRPGPIDPEISGAGTTRAPDAKTYDEVIERYAGQEEV